MGVNFTFNCIMYTNNTKNNYLAVFPVNSERLHQAKDSALRSRERLQVNQHHLLVPKCFVALE